MRVSKWGNSLAVRLPNEVVKTLGLKAGDDIEITIAKPKEFQVERDNTRQRAIAQMRALRKPLPKGFKFNRDDANAR